VSETGAALPTVSVALCTRDGAAYLRAQLESILAQRPAPLEIVLGDDASSDGSVELAEEVVAAARAADPALATELVVRRHEPALGVTANFADAMAACRGELIALSDQDDVWAPGRLARLAPLFAAAPRLDLVHTDARLVDADGAPLGGSLLEALEATAAERAGLERGDAFAVLLRRNLVTGATVVLRRSLLEAAAPFPADWVHDEWLAAVAAGRTEGAALRLVPEPLIDYRQHGANAIGARRPTLADKRARLAEPHAVRAARLARRAAALVERLEGLGAPAPRLEAARAKAAHEAARAGLPRLRLARWPRVLAWAVQGRYGRYSRGAIDVLRDLVQPAGEAAT